MYAMRATAAHNGLGLGDGPGPGSRARRTARRKAYGMLTGKFIAVLEALLWGFHNARSGLCFPSYETIADKAGCARSTVCDAIQAREEAGILS